MCVRERETERERERERERWTEREKEKKGGRMQCFMKTQLGVDNVETTYFDNCAFFAALAFFCCYSFVNVASLAFCTTYFTFLSGGFIVLSCWRYPSQPRYDFCAQIDISDARPGGVIPPPPYQCSGHGLFPVRFGGL